jgi:hypothetical protein
MRFLIAAVALIHLPGTAQPAPDQLIHAAIAARQAQDEKGWKFTYREDEDRFEKDKKGTVVPGERRTYDVIMLEGEPYRKLIRLNGQPLDEKMQRRVEQEMEAARAERRAHKRGTIERSVVVAELESLEKLFDNKVIGAETLGGRQAWRMESQPKAGYKPANKEEAQALGARRITWFDQQEGVELKHLDVFIRATNGFQPGSEMELEYGKVGEAWLPAAQSLRIDFKVFAVVHARGETRYRFYDYKKFEVESKVIE